MAVQRKRTSGRTASCRGAALWVTAGVASLLFSLASCSRGESMLMVQTPYFDSAFPRSERGISKGMGALGFSLEVRTVNPDISRSDFAALLEESTAGFVVVTPFLADRVAAAAPVFAERRFLLLFADRIETQPNLQRLTTDRSTTFYRAGALCADLPAEGIVGDGGPVVLGVLAYTGTERRKREIETFLEGYRETSGDRSVPSPRIRELSSLDEERVATREAVDMSAESGIMLLSLGPMNAAVLRTIAGAGGALVITERLVGGEGQPDSVPGASRVLAFIEEDWVSGVAAAVDSRNPRVVIPSRLVPGPAADRVDLGGAERRLE